ncbi:Carboxylesterase NlhH [Fulvia fulva]|uniref:Carboxylesterase NlhH n=1 Tax=Passalora fulva TaxID=5499 RepID=A0A9Q8PAF0_PASFU|nr:Carboxylesterase NlhH [Fulvia fulva]KAK4621489.1 Carboxylesterase NlhH [Fulvia fulva]KAK4623397.1 Carboxylesterase NlhH [Fulvia fulva]UJO18869.1 Carboxylesterase NlhH [Fulvia fulva]WPV16333.1 Carboxylesterase NlhH [Fulvia fulva]WPV31503.1 Carboxylesterase NlhH [Fulvia fulva]
MSLETDPRMRPDLLAALKPLQMAINADAPPMDRKDTAAIEALNKQFSENMVTLYETLPNDLPGDDLEAALDESEITIDGQDGNKIKLYIRKPKNASTPLPAVLYIHGGGMTILNTAAKHHLRWIKSFALQGVVAMAVDFRNAWTLNGRNPFPAGLNDCAAAVKYIHAHKSSLGISHLILQGESGGANLSIATTIKANREGWVDAIAGIYALVPYIAGPEGFGWDEAKRLEVLPSLVENNGYFLHTNLMDAMGYYYHPVDSDLTNPLAWPYHAKVEDLKGLPPFVVCVDELDPLRDEGKAFLKKLIQAGVRASGEMNLGIVHGSEMISRKAIPDMYEKTVRGIVGFAKGLGEKREVEGLKI